jgi:small GTP-binding protein
MAVKGKVVLVGDASVGKTSILLAGQHLDSTFVEPTINVTTIPLTIRTQNYDIHLNFWDTAGQELYRSFVPMFVRGSEVGVIVFDVTRVETFQNIRDWISLFDDLPPGQCQLVIVGNKCEMAEWDLEIEEVREFCERGKYPLFVTSAKSNEGIQELFEQIARIVHGKAGNVTLPTQVVMGQESGENQKEIKEEGCKC